MRVALPAATAASPRQLQQAFIVKNEQMNAHSMRIKRFLAILLLPMLFLCACGDPVYADGIACEALTNALPQDLSVEGGWQAVGDEFFRFTFPEAEGFDDHSVICSVRAEDINELGVFHAKSDADGERLRGLCEAYLRRMQEEERAFIASYAPEELTKLDAAEVRLFGRYVVYTVLSPADREAVFSEIKARLREAPPT